MKRLHLLSTAAASLLLAAGAAAAQGMHQQTPDRAPAAQRNAPAEKIAPSMHAGDRKGSETTGQAPKGSESGKPEMNDESKRGESGKEMKSPSETKSGAGAEENAQRNSGASEKSSATVNSKGSTTGQGAASGSAKLSSTQRSKITTIIKKQSVKPTQLNISVHVGARIPASVHFYPLPTEVVEVYPEWRGYEYILVGDQIIVVDPDSHEVVAVLET